MRSFVVICIMAIALIVVDCAEQVIMGPGPVCCHVNTTCANPKLMKCPDLPIKKPPTTVTPTKCDSDDTYDISDDEQTNSGT